MPSQPWAQSDDELISQFDAVGWEEWAIAAGIFIVAVVASRIVLSLVARALTRTSAGQFVTSCWPGWWQPSLFSSVSGWH